MTSEEEITENKLPAAIVNPELPKFDFKVDDIISKLLNSSSINPIKLEYEECMAIAVISQRLFLLEPMVLEISTPLHVCGDIHGQFIDLIRLFDLCGAPPKSRFLFLGDYVDRGTYGVECVSLLFSLKIRYPKHIYLIRGNHESEIVNRSYGFRAEIRSKYCSSKLWRLFLKTFNSMPICAIVDKTIFCCHGGLSPAMLKTNVHTLQDLLNNIKRPLEVTNEGLICDILWSDPADVVDENTSPKGWEDSERGCSFTFGYDVVENFLDKFDLDLIIRGHQVVEDGYEFFCNRKLVTVFSAPNYCGKFDNAGGIFVLSRKVDDDDNIEEPIIEGRFLVMKPSYNSEKQWEYLPKCVQSTITPKRTA